MQEVVRKKFKFEFHVSPVTDNDKPQRDYEIIFDNLRKDVRMAEKGLKKVELLSLVSSSWSVRQTAEFFNVSGRTVKDAKLLRNERENGEIDRARVNWRPSLDSLVANTIPELYLDDKNPRQLFGMKDCVSVRQEDGKRVLMQKKLILCNLGELFEEYKNKHPDHTVSLSKFYLLMDNLEKLLLHDFVVAKQAKCFANAKETLREGYLIVVFDFAENCTFVAQRAVQGFHSNNEQATLFPVTVYSVEDGVLHRRSYAFISDCLKHDSVAVYIFQKKMIEIQARFWPDREAEWHVFATSRGKAPCDGLAGCIKRDVARASLQGRIILNSVQLYEWTKGAIKNVGFFHIPKSSYEETREFLETQRFSYSKTVNGTQSYHTSIPVEDSIGLLTVKTFSDASDSKTARAYNEP
ncbi:hypothetical protein QAD02_020909 [Eretmocerus hayati]|uniref:Uncharacterized protein n=1 Tax=Eretmocerus hayati TaxID=131215 RepID=A0ACC2PNN6_9HYME|nr:hypothetical protein QAD02_020909 [Eretmocerus hayati]